MRANEFLFEIGDRPEPYKANPRRRRSLFHSEVDGNWVDVFFDRSPINGSLQITFAVNQNYEPAGPSSASRSTIRILSTVLNIIKQQLPEYIKKARPPAVTFTAKGQGRADLYRKYFVPVVQNILGPQWQLEDLPGETTLFSWRPVKRTVVESQQATAKQVLGYINRTHHEPFRPGEKMHAAVLAHPHWQLQRVPLLNLNIPDQEYDDADDDYEPEADPYNRVMAVEPEHAGEVSMHLVDQYPIVIDADRYIIDGNHRAWAAKYLLNRDYINAWVPVEQKQTVAEARIPRAIEDFLDGLTADDVGVEEFGPYRVHFEGFTDDCKSSSDYRRNPEAVYQQVYNDFIQREGGRRPVIQDMVGDEDYPILYSIFKIPKQGE